VSAAVVVALGREVLREEVAELDRLAVGEKVNLAALSLLRREERALDDVDHVACRREVAPSADPAEASLLHRSGELRQEARVSASPDEARADRHRLERERVRRDHGALGESLRDRIRARGLRGIRHGLVGAHDRLAVGDDGLGADVDEALHLRSLRGAERVLRAVDGVANVIGELAVFADVGGRVKHDVAFVHALGHRGLIREVATHGLGTHAAHGDRCLLAACERAHGDAFRDERTDQLLAHEPRTAGDECSLHPAESTRFAGCQRRTTVG
jgi:hypothetical protein